MKLLYCLNPRFRGDDDVRSGRVAEWLIAPVLKTNRPYFYLYFLFKINHLEILTLPVYTYTSVTHFYTCRPHQIKNLVRVR